MDQATHNKIVSFIWGIADDVLRDLFKRGKYPDVILPMCVIRRMDAVLEPTKQAVLDTKKMLDKSGITEQRAALCEAAGQAFYNTSKFTLRDLKSRGSQQQLLADFEDYLNGFSPNVQDILENFKFRNQLPTLSKADAIGTLINKFLDPDDRPLSGRHRQPRDGHGLRGAGPQVQRGEQRGGGRALDAARRRAADGEPRVPAHRGPDQVRHLPALRLRLRHGRHAHGGGGDAHGDRREARPAGQVPPLRPGDQPRDLRRLQGGHAAQRRRRERRPHRRRRGMVHALARRLPGARVRLHARQPALREELEERPRGDGRQGRHARPALQGDARGRGALARHALERRPDALPRQHGVEDERKSALGSRIAEVHNGSSLFTGDAGQGESNIRRWLIENDWLEAIVALPLNLFYNTGIATYIWVLSNKKPAHRKGQVQLIDATQWFKPLRKNLGKKNCELSPEDIERISRTFLDFKETPESKIFPNAAFGYWKVTVERPLRLHSQLSLKAIETLRFASGDEDLRAALYEEFGDDLFTKFAKVSPRWKSASPTGAATRTRATTKRAAAPKKGLPEKKKKKLLDPKTWERDGRLVEAATALRAALGDKLFEDHNVFRDRVDAALKKAGLKLPAADLKQILKAVSWRVETAPPVIAKVHKPGKAKADPLRGLFEATVDGKPAIVEYEPDSDLRDTEQVPLLEDGGIEAFIRREVLPYTPDAWIKEDATKIGYEVSFTRHFYKPQPLRTLEEISADILAIEKEAEGLLDDHLTGKRSKPCLPSATPSRRTPSRPCSPGSSPARSPSPRSSARSCGSRPRSATSSTRSIRATPSAISSRGATPP